MAGGLLDSLECPPGRARRSFVAFHHGLGYMEETGDRCWVRKKHIGCDGCFCSHNCLESCDVAMDANPHWRRSTRRSADFIVSCSARGNFAGYCGRSLSALPRGRNVIEILVPIYACWLLVSVALTLVAPGASYLFVWPTIVGLAVLALVLVLQSGTPIRPEARLSLAAATFPALILLLPAIGLVHYAMGSRFETIVSMVCMTLVVTLFAPALAVFEQGGRDVFKLRLLSRSRSWRRKLFRHFSMVRRGKTFRKLRFGRRSRQKVARQKPALSNSRS